MKVASSVRGALFPAILACSAGAASAQAATDLFRITLAPGAVPSAVAEVTRITNRAGYDNQPHVLADGTILFTSIDDTGQADIHRFDPATGRISNVTRTSPESEYSATLMPGGERMSVIRVEADSTQRLWSFKLDGTDPQVLLEEIRPVGYHAWIDAARIALFVLGDPATLRIADLTTGLAREVARDIGRSLHAVPGREAVSYVQRTGEGAGWIRMLDLQAGDSRRLIEPFEENEYHAWTQSGVLITGRGSRLYRFQPDSDSEWVEIADLAAHGVREISRLAVGPDGRTVVVVAAH